MTSSKPKQAKTLAIGQRSKKLLERQVLSTARLSLWLDWEIPSANTFRYKHWSKVRQINQGAKLAWLSALRSSDSAVKSLMRIISSLAPNPSETLSREGSVLTMVTNAFAGDTARSLPSAQAEPLSVSKGSNE